MTITESLVSNLLNSLHSEIDKWLIDKHEAIHKEYGIALWIGNGWSYIRITKPFEINFKIAHKIKIHKAINNLKVAKCLKVFEKSRVAS